MYLGMNLQTYKAFGMALEGSGMTWEAFNMAMEGQLCVIGCMGCMGSEMAWQAPGIAWKHQRMPRKQLR